eukprot:910117-Pleurochrysis_carterae.AAC.3
MIADACFIGDSIGAAEQIGRCSELSQYKPRADRRCILTGPLRSFQAQLPIHLDPTRHPPKPLYTPTRAHIHVPCWTRCARSHLFYLRKSFHLLRTLHLRPKARSIHTVMSAECASRLRYVDARCGRSNRFAC